MLSPEARKGLKQAQRSRSRGRVTRWRCSACRHEWSLSKSSGVRGSESYRLCAFHPGTHVFTMYNKRCATASRLRWLLREHGVPLYHGEVDGNYATFSMGFLGADGEFGGRLLGTWKKGYEWTLQLAVIGLNLEVRPLDLETAERIMAEYSFGDEDETRVLSVDFTR